MFVCLYAPPRGLAFRSDDGVPRAKHVTDQLVRLAREYSPRIEIHGDNLVVLDTTGLTSLFSNARELGATLRRSAADRGLYLRIAVASTRTAALLVVQARSGLTVIEPGREAGTLASLSLDVLKALALAQGTATRMRRGTRVVGAALAARGESPTAFDRRCIPPGCVAPRSNTVGILPRRALSDGRITGLGATRDFHHGLLAIPAFALLSTVRRWGVRTLGDLVRLPSAELFERLGSGGLTLQRFARGEDEGPLVPVPVEERFESSLVLEWPIEGIEPLSFVLSRVFDQLCARLDRAGVGAAVIHVRLKLVTREVHTRTLQLPTPLRDPRVLRALVLLDLESHPPSAGIDQVTVVVDPVPTRTQQFSLLERARPSSEKVATLVARLTALAGEGRCGSPALVDSHDTAGFEMQSFGNNTIRSGPSTHSTTTRTAPLRTGQDRRGVDRVRETPVDGDWRPFNNNTELCPMLRRFRVPVAARVRVRKGRPVRVVAPRVSGGEVVHWAGPWRTSGQWWTNAPTATLSDGASPWDRDEWDVSLTDGGVYRIFHDRRVDRWFLEGMVD